ncbi:hypothetical protein PYW07_011003 [Mythimna separata]|uniref:Vinculin n=1 Tax=Mythimna separata TaxID=271217 RepID=A0AAD7Y761_MYTSE|nr:hypothetical protein PYW07_011003 [Mythimna separata]
MRYLTAPAIHEPHCQSALTAASANLSGAVNQLEASWKPLMEDPKQHYMAGQLHGRKNDVLKALDRLRDGYWNLEVAECTDDVFPVQEKKRLKFITSLAGARNRLLGVEFDEWNKPPTDKAAPSEEEKVAAQRRLEQTMAQLNAAVAALAAATADRENPDYDTAELAVTTMTELMPQIAKDLEVVSSDKDEATRAAMQKSLSALCHACKDMCQGDGYQHAQGEPLDSFTAASGKLVFLVSPGADKGKQKHISSLASEAQQQASELAARARQVKEHAAPAAAAELDKLANQAQDDADALRAVAQVTAASIESPRCRDALSAAIAKLQGSADRLASACQAQQAPQTAQARAAADDAHQELCDSLAKLGDVCGMGHDDDMLGDAPSAAQQEKQRLKFVQSMAGAKRRLDAAAQQLTKPMACSLMSEADAKVLEQQLSNSLAQLNAAVAALAAATADRENPDYVAAEKAVDDITTLMPHVVRDSRKLCGTKSDAAQAQMLQDIKVLCDASKELCDSVGQPQGLADAAARFTAASRNLVFYASPGADNDKENEVIGLSADACGKAGQLLSQAQLLTEMIPDATAAAELDNRGARAADAAQALLTVAQATAPTISNANCQRELISAAEKLRGTATDLTSSCQPHLQQRPEMKQQVLGSKKQLDDSLDKLVDACKTVQGGTQSSISPAEKEKRRLKFVTSLTGAKNRLYDSEQQLKQPLTKQPLEPEEALALEQRLTQRLAQLNAAIAALAVANADAANPDYVAAEKAVKEISDLMPLIVQDSRKLSSTKDEPTQAAMLADLRALCEASRKICENTENSPKVDTTEFSKAAGKLVFLVSPAADKGKGKQVLDLSDAACKKASDHLSQVQAVSAQLPPAAAAQLGAAATRLKDAADTLHAVAHATAPTIGNPHCQKEVAAAAEKLHSAASELTACVEPHLQKQPEKKKQVLGSQQKLAESLDKLVQACQAGDSGNLVAWPSAQQQEKQHLMFISSVSGAKERLNAAEELLKEPMVCQLMRPEDGAAMERKLNNRLAQLNAAVAALAAATADRERPDYAAADRAVKTITELMPGVVQDSHTLCGNKTGDEQAAMLQDLRALCEATRQICDSAGEPQGLNEAAAKFSAASGKLVYIVSPKADAKQQAHEKQVLALSAASCGKASELLSQAQRVTELIPDAAVAAELDARGARAADAAQALLTVAQATAPTIGDPHCRKEVISAAEKLRSTAADLTSACQPHLQKQPEMKKQVLSTQQQLADSLDKLVQACKTDVGSVGWDVPSAETQEKQRLKFVSSVSGAKQRLDAAEKQLKEPMVSQLTRPEDGAAMERKLSNRLAQLNAAVAALAAATADRERPDYAAADRAVRTITELMPEVVQDSHKLCGSKTGPEQAAMLQDLRALCEATRQICDSAGEPQGLNEAAAKFSAASGKLVYIVSPKADAKQQAHEKQVLALSAASCGKASELLSQAQRLTELIPDAAVAAELDARGARAADAAQALLTVAQATAPTIGDPHCRKEVVAAAEKLRSTAADLTSACQPHLQKQPEMKKQVLSTQQQLADSLDKLVQACNTDVGSVGWDVPSAETQEKQRLKFVSSVSGAKQRLDAAEKQLKEPMVSQLMRPEDGAAMERKLSNRLAQLNAAVAALAAATADRERPDYAAADRAVRTITELMPGVVQDSHKLCGSKTGPEQAAMLQDLRALCDATRQICDSAGEPQGLSDAAAKFSAASGKLVYIVSPKADAKQQAHEKQVLALSAASCGKASELLSQAQRLTELIPDAVVAAELDARGARAADAAQALLTVAQATAPTIGDPHCRKEVVAAAEKLRNTAADLTSACQPHLQKQPEMKKQVLSTQQQLADSLDKLVQACNTDVGSVGWDVPSAETQEKQRLKFVSSVSGAKQRLDAAEKQLKEPMICQLMRAEDGAAIERKLSNRLAQLNAAVAALAAATADRERPDYAAADRAVRTITELMPGVVQDSHKLCGNKAGDEQAAMLQDLRALCDATRQICDSAGKPQGLSEAAAKFSAASGKLTYIVSPKADAKQQAHEKQVLALSAASCGKASELLSGAQRLTELIPDAAVAAELDARGARAADAAQALLTVAQATAPTIGDPHCQREVVAAAEKLRSTTSDLTSACQPHLQQRPEMKQQVLSSKKQLDDSLDKLVDACKTDGSIGWVDVPPAQTQEKQRLKFISSVSGAKEGLHAAEQQLKEPMICQLMRAEDGAAIERKLSNRLAQLNAAVAALAAATANREKPDYVEADRAVRTITKLMPQLVQDSHKLCGTKTGPEQAAMMKELKALCEATRQICDSAGEPQGLSDAAAKFSAASGKLVYIVSPEAAKQDTQEKQVLALSAATCGKTSELLSQAQRLTELIPDAAVAAELDARGARAADAAQALLTVAQATAPTIGNPHCQKEMISAADKLHRAASALTWACHPHVQQRPELKEQMLSCKKQLDANIYDLKQACKTAHHADQEKHRVKFDSSATKAKKDLQEAQSKLSQPITTKEKPEDPVPLRKRLSNSLAQLNAAIAALTAATADREYPDYTTAHQVVETIPKLLREVIHDSRELCANQTGPGAAAVTSDLTALCEASRELCDSVGQPQDLAAAASKYSAASGKMAVLAGPKIHSAEEKQVIALTTESRERVSSLLEHVHRLTEVMPEVGAAAELDESRARTAEAAQALFSVAQVTSSSISEPACADQMASAAEKLLRTASELTSACQPHLEQHPERKQQVLSSQQQLADRLDKLILACHAAQQEPEVVLSPQQEKQRIHFVSSVSGAKKNLDTAEQQMKKPLVPQKKQADGASLQQQLSRRLAQLNAAVAALAAATQVPQELQQADGASLQQQLSRRLAQLNAAVAALAAATQGNCVPAGSTSGAAASRRSQPAAAAVAAPGAAQRRRGSPGRRHASSTPPWQPWPPPRKVTVSQPVVPQELQQADGASLQQQLSRRLAQLNAAVAALAAATQDGKNLDYPAAERAVITITELMPQVVHDSHSLCSSKDAAGQAAMLEQLRQLCDASRAICDSHGQPKKLNEATAKLANASGKLLYIVSPESAQGSKPAVPVRKAPPPTPVRDPKTHSVAQAVRSSALVDPTKDFLDTLRGEASQDNAKTVDVDSKNLQAIEEAKKAYKHFMQMIDSAEKGLQTAEDGLKVLHSSKTAAACLPAVEVARREQHMEDALAKAAVQVAALVAANYADTLDYKAAMEPTLSLTECVRSVVNDGSAIYSSLPEHSRKHFVDDMAGLCRATKSICNATKSKDEVKKLNDAAISFGDQSIKLLRVVSCITDPPLEKQVISRAKAIGDTASRLALEASNVASSADSSTAEGKACVQDICTAGASCVDAAGKLVYTAKHWKPAADSSTAEGKACVQDICTAGASCVDAAGKLVYTAKHWKPAADSSTAEGKACVQDICTAGASCVDAAGKLVYTAKHWKPAADSSTAEGKACVQDICTAGASCVDAAGKLVYTAKHWKPAADSSTAEGKACVQDICTAGASCVDAAGKLVYTAKHWKPAADSSTAEGKACVQDICTAGASCVDAAGKLVYTAKHWKPAADSSTAEGKACVQDICTAGASCVDAAGKLVYTAKHWKPAADSSTAEGKACVQDICTAGASCVDAAGKLVYTAKHWKPAADSSTAEGKACVQDICTAGASCVDAAGKLVYTAKHWKPAADSSTAEGKACVQDICTAGASCVDAAGKLVYTAKHWKPAADSSTAEGKACVQDICTAGASCVDAAGKLVYTAKHWKPAADSSTAEGKACVQDICTAGASCVDAAGKLVYTAKDICTAGASCVDAAGKLVYTAKHWKPAADSSTAEGKACVQDICTAGASCVDAAGKLVYTAKHWKPAADSSTAEGKACVQDICTAGASCVDAAGKLVYTAKHWKPAADSSTAEGKACVQDICTAGASCVDAAGKLVYTAKLVAPTIHHATCQETLVSSADNLSASLTKFSKSWAPLASSQQPTIHKLTQEAAHLEDLVERMRKDVKTGKLGKRKEVEQIVNLDSPLRKMTIEIIETAKSMAEYGEMTAEQKKEYTNYSHRLEEAIRVLDLANARYQRAPTDKNRHDEYEIATQDLQVTLLQTRPSRAGQEQNNIVDFRDFLQDLAKEADQLQSTAKKNEGPAGKRTTDDIKLLCSKISEDATRLLNPPDHFADVTVCESADDIMDIDMFGQDCDMMVKEINSTIQGVHDQKAKQALRAKALALTESCHLLRFATNSHIMATKSAAFEDALSNLEEFKATVIPHLAQEAVMRSKKIKKILQW